MDLKGVHWMGLIRVDDLWSAVLWMILMLGNLKWLVLRFMKAENIWVFEGRVCWLVERMDFMGVVFCLVKLRWDGILDCWSCESRVLSSCVRDSKVCVPKLLDCSLVSINWFIDHSFSFLINDRISWKLGLRQNTRYKVIRHSFLVFKSNKIILVHSLLMFSHVSILCKIPLHVDLVINDLMISKFSFFFKLLFVLSLSSVLFFSSQSLVVVVFSICNSYMSFSLLLLVLKI